MQTLAIFTIIFSIFSALLLAIAHSAQPLAFLMGSAYVVCFFIADLTLIRSPNITIEVEEAAQVTYATSTLKHIDCDKTLADLKQLMEQEKLYINENINLAEIATLLKLTSHQLSELINSKLNKRLFTLYTRISHYRSKATINQ
ncbi:MAG: hypothetical protein KAG34_01290 [Cocleimonas sp.]|nr:hypothetical protein [Cocleimonas sp.]